MTVPWVRDRKRSRGAEPLVMVTAYDTPGSRIADRARVDIVLVGDSVANTVLGYQDTLSVTISDMVHHVAAVARARPHCLVVADMPWLSYHLSIEDAVRNAASLIRAGAEAIKLEGGLNRVRVVEAIVDAEIPVMGHLGLTPQSVHAMGGYRVQAKSTAAAEQLLQGARALAAAGCFSVVLEGVPDVVGSEVTGALEIPTIGIGAGSSCDGQVLVFHDLLGLLEGSSPKFVRRYAELGDLAVNAIAQYADDVRAGRFPGEEESYHGSDELREAFGRQEPGLLT